MIKISQLTKKFAKLSVLDNLDLEISKGGVFAILGPNGSGKTTLIKSILGMVIPNSGEIKINDKSVLYKYEYRNNISYLPQIANFPNNLKIHELLSMIKDVRSQNGREQELLSLFGIETILDQKLSTLSGGTKQKVNLVLTFMFDNDLIILDEPTSGLDPVSAISLKKLIQEEKEKGKTILITTHIMSLVDEIADEIVFLLEGKIYFKGSVNNLKSQTGESNLEHAVAKLISGHHV